MDVMVLIDSFKGSMTSMEAGNAARDGVLRVYPHANVTVRPLADGGEGTTDALIEGLGGRKVELSVTGPMGSRVKAYYGILADEKTAVMEMAQAAGITLVEEAQRNPGKSHHLWSGRDDTGCRFARMPQIHHWNRRKCNK
ncbi:MAG: glycerate kinase [Roseburia hominis]